jgi:hypothetical protein
VRYRPCESSGVGEAREQLEGIADEGEQVRAASRGQIIDGRAGLVVCSGCSR